MRIIGDIMHEGEHLFGYPSGSKHYVGGLKDEFIEDGLPYEFGEMQPFDIYAGDDKGGNPIYKTEYYLPADRDKFKWAISGVGGLINDGEYIGYKAIKDAFGYSVGEKSLGRAPRPALGFDKYQKEAFIFAGVSNWEIPDIA